jgi:hypothetical protein
MGERASRWISRHRRRDRLLRRPRTIWIVRDGERVFIRSTEGRGADWFRGATDTGTGQISAGGQTYEVLFTEVTDALTSLPPTPATGPRTGATARS